MEYHARMNATRKQAAGLIVLVFLVGMIGGGALSSYTMMEDGSMHTCPYMGVTALCDMTPLAHLSQWQSMSSGIAQFSLFTFLLLIALFVASHLVTNLAVFAESTPGVSRYRHTERIFDSLRLAFARGLIHPKTF